MYCPNCGKDNSNDQKFCRSCGLGLQSISHALVDELSGAKEDQGSTKITDRGQKRWHVPLTYGFLMLVLGLAIIFLGKTVLGEQLIADIGTAVAFLGIMIFGYKGVSLMFPRSTSLSKKETRVLPRSEPTNKLPSATQFDGVPSVTEDTTRHLEKVPRERKTE